MLDINKNKIKIFLFTMFSTLLILGVTYVAYHNYGKTVKQTVTLITDKERTQIILKQRYYYYEYNPNLGETYLKRIALIENEIDRIHHSKYKLVTFCKWKTNIDCGDAKFIDSIKCIRYTEMTKAIANYERMDSIAIAKENAKEAETRNELKALNTPCK